MSSLLVILLLVIIAPLLVGDWRASLVGLALQGFLLAAIAWQSGHAFTADGALVLLDFGVVRGLVAPIFLGRIMAARKAAKRSDVIPVNLLSWALAAGLILISFRAASQLVPADDTFRLRVAVTGSGALLAMLVLATQNSMIAQIIGAIRLENSIALLESGTPHGESLVVQAALTGVFLFTIIVFGLFLRRQDLDTVTTPGTAETEAPSL